MDTKKIHLSGLFLMLILFLYFFVSSGNAQEISLYVSPSGNDSRSGKTLNEPFATLQKARDAVRLLKQNGQLTSPVTVYLRGGTYELSEPFILTLEDSGTETCPVTYRAYQSEKPVISGGKKITGQWEAYKGKIMVCTIPEAVDGKWKFRQLFLNGKRQIRARIPDNNYYRIEKTTQDIGKSAMKFKEGDFKKWNNLDEVEVVLFHSWNESRLFVSEVDEVERIVTFTGPIGARLSGFGIGENRYYIENVLEGLDQAGEWYLDSHTGKLYLYPTDDLKKSELRAPKVNQLIRLDGNLKEQKYVQYVKFIGLTFADVDYLLPKEGIPTLPDVGDLYKPSAITLESTKFCTFEDNCIRNVGTYALEVTGDGNRITGNEIYDAGAGGVITRSYGKERNVISYNHIHHCGEVFHSGVGVNIDDGGGEISHNLVHDISHTGIYGRHWGTDYQEQERRNQEQGLIIEYNEIHDVVQRMNDGAGIFIRDSNITIKNNLIYNVYSFKYLEKLGDYNNCGVPGWGIYLGCETRDSRVENNVLFNITEAMHVFYGTRNVAIENNMFINCEVKNIRYETPKDLNMTNNRFLRNIVYSSSPYTETFNISSENGLPVESDYNVLFHAGGKTPVIKSRIGIDSFDAWLKRGFDKNSVVADPLFADPVNHDFSLLPGSPALKLGFKPIDLSNVGLRGKRK